MHGPAELVSLSRIAQVTTRASNFSRFACFNVGFARRGSRKRIFAVSSPATDQQDHITVVRR